MQSALTNVKDEPKKLHKTSCVNFNSPSCAFCSAAHSSVRPGISEYGMNKGTNPLRPFSASVQNFQK